MFMNELDNGFQKSISVDLFSSDRKNATLNINCKKFKLSKNIFTISRGGNVINAT